MSQEIGLRAPTAKDGVAIWRMIGDLPYLDQNTLYYYLLFCEHFSETCVVAESGDRVVGFLTAYCEPHRPDVLFVWQTGVLPDWQGQGLAGRMLRSVLRRESLASLAWVEATVTPSNAASKGLFQGLARRLDVSLEERPFFTEDLFAGLSEPHEEEMLLRVGPLPFDKGVAALA